MISAQSDAAFLDLVRKLINGKTVFGVLEELGNKLGTSAEICLRLRQPR